MALAVIRATAGQPPVRNFARRLLPWTARAACTLRRPQTRAFAKSRRPGSSEPSLETELVGTRETAALPARQYSIFRSEEEEWPWTAEATYTLRTRLFPASARSPPRGPSPQWLAMAF